MPPLLLAAPEMHSAQTNYAISSSPSAPAVLRLPPPDTSTGYAMMQNVEAGYLPLRP
ncbi:MAG TPA: hypothetical protein VMJ12_17675 [Candidatus Acidoferrales bacterium]|nr:hypothetical protein [Candidatus Acidoferrales bacterium]